ncbi:phosphatase PAP2 family protein [Parafrigoribacterium mesophilum]|uniref:phosphatase PAP2 family protein n=1 Tax=Parafrigoribacterium mesophilum TaxID=433646 RepID=UPI0031FD6182
MNQGTRPGVFVMAAFGLAVVFTLVYLFAVRTHAGQVLDERAFDGARLGQRSIAPVTLSLLDALPVIAVVIAFLVAVVVTAVRRNWVSFFVAMVAAALANLATQVLKELILNRPDFGVHGYAFNSFPSGHTTLAASAALVFFLAVSPNLRPMAAAVGAMFTIATGVSTLANQWHRPSDVMAALLVVAFFGCIAGAILTSVRPHLDPPARSPWNSALDWTAVLCVVVAGLAVAGSVTGLPLPMISLPLAYIGGVASICAVGFLLAVAASRSFRTFR